MPLSKTVQSPYLLTSVYSFTSHESFINDPPRPVTRKNEEAQKSRSRNADAYGRVQHPNVRGVGRSDAGTVCNSIVRVYQMNRTDF